MHQTRHTATCKVGGKVHCNPHTPPLYGHWAKPRAEGDKQEAEGGEAVKRKGERGEERRKDKR